MNLYFPLLGGAFQGICAHLHAGRKCAEVQHQLQLFGHAEWNRLLLPLQGWTTDVTRV